MTLEEIQEKGNQDAAFKKQVVEWASTTDEGKEILDNYLGVKKESIVSEALTAQKESIFATLKDSGIEIKEDVTIESILKEFSNKYKEALGRGDDSKVKELESKIKEMEESGEANKFYKVEFEKLKSKLTEVNEAHKSELEKRDKDFFDTRVKSEIKAGLSGLQYNKEDKAVNALISTVENQLLSNVKEVDGKLIFGKDAENEYRDASFNAMSISEILKQELDGYLDSSTTGGGADRRIDKGSVIDDDKGGSKLVLNPRSFSTKTEFMELAEKALIAKGIDVMSEQGLRMREAAYTEYNVTNLK